MVVPSLSCPAACAYCFGPNDGPKMDVPMARRVLKFMESVVVETGQDRVRMTLHGGEPLAAGHDVVEALVEGAYRRFGALGVSIAVQSNLWLLDDRYCELFAKYGVSVSTSLDGPEEINRLQRGEGYYEQTMRGIGLARSHGLRPGCIATFTSRSAPNWRGVFDFFHTRDQQFCVHPCVAAIENSTGLELTPESYAGLFLAMFDRYLENRKSIRIETFDQICQGVAQGRGTVCTFQDCFGMFLSVDPHGDVYTCQRFAGRRDYRLGNIAEHPAMQDLASGGGALRLLRREALIAQRCGSCEHYKYCRGGCPYNALAAGDPDGPDPYCEAYKRIFAEIRQRLHGEMVSDENMRAVAELGPAENGNPLLRVGPVTSLTRGNTHPYHAANTARSIVAAYTLAAGPDMAAGASKLKSDGVYRSEADALAALQSLRAAMEPGGRLNKLYLHVTWNCQLRCSHCYASAQAQPGGAELSAAGIASAAVEGARCGFREIVLTGGEPLLLKDRAGLLEALCEIRRNIKLAKLVLRTNFAMPLTLRELELLSRAFDEIVVSVDGGREEHDLRRGDGAYDAAVTNLERYVGDVLNGASYRAGGLRPARLSLSATMGAGQANGPAGRAVRDLGDRLGKLRVKFRPLLPLGRALEWEDSIAPEPLYAHLSPLELIEQGFRPAMSCGIGQNLYVEPDGGAYPCYACHPQESKLGNLLTDGLAAIVAGESFRALQAHTVDTNRGCRGCAYRYLCGGACRAWGRKASELDLDAAPAECGVLKKRAGELHRAALEYLGL